MWHWLQCLCKPWAKPSAQKADKSVFSFVSATAEARVPTTCKTASSVLRPHRLWQNQSKRSQVTNVLVDFGQVLQKTRLQIERFASAAVRLPGSGGSGGQLWLFWAAWAVGGAVGGPAAAPAAEKTCFDRFGRLRVGKSSTRMANRCPRIFDAGGKGRDPVGCWRSLHH